MAYPVLTFLQAPLRTEIRQSPPESAGVRQSPPESAGVRQSPPESARVLRGLWRTPADSGGLWRTLAGGGPKIHRFEDFSKNFFGFGISRLGATQNVFLAPS